MRIGISKLTAADAPIWVKIGGVGVRTGGCDGRSLGEGGGHGESIRGGSRTETGIG